MVSRAESILHLTPAVFKNAFIRNHYSISRHQILCVNGFFYVPEVDVATTPTGIVKQARRLVKRYGVYSLDTEAAPVIVEFLSKVGNVCQCLSMFVTDHDCRRVLVRHFNLKRKTIFFLCAFNLI